MTGLESSGGCGCAWIVLGIGRVDGWNMFGESGGLGARLSVMEILERVGRMVVFDSEVRRIKVGGLCELRCMGSDNWN